MKITNFEELVEAINKLYPCSEFQIYENVIKWNEAEKEVRFYRKGNKTVKGKYFFSNHFGDPIIARNKDPQKILDVIIAIKNCED